MISTASGLAMPMAKLMIFGGEDHKVYLRCLNCSSIAPDSVHNSIGPHGSNIAHSEQY